MGWLRTLLPWAATAVGAAAVAAAIGYLAGTGAEDDDRRRAAALSSACAPSAHPHGSKSPEESIHDIETLLSTAEMFVQSHRFRDAERQYLAALDLVSQTVGSESSVAALIHHELGTLYKMAERLSSAEESFGRAAQILRPLAVADVAEGDAPAAAARAKAESSYVRSLCEIADVKSLRTRSCADAEANRNSLAESLALATEAVSVLERRSGEVPKEAADRTELADALRSLTQVRMFQKEWPAAEAAVRRCIDLRLRCTYATDAGVVMARMWLSQILLGQEKYAEADEACAALAETHRGTAEEAYFLRYHGEVLVDCDDFDRAERQLLRALRLYRREAELSGSSGVPRDYWVTLNSLAVVYELSERSEIAEVLREEIREGLCAGSATSAPETTSKHLRTLQAAIRPTADESSSSACYVLNVLVRERRSKKLPPGSVLEFCFQNPESQDHEPVAMSVEKVVAEDTRALLVSSPALNGFHTGMPYMLRVVARTADRASVISTHTQIVFYDRPDSGLDLS
eukprot:m51a1_g2581 hypothetical protein (517) ;mRNA; r:395494-397203